MWLKNHRRKSDTWFSFVSEENIQNIKNKCKIFKIHPHCAMLPIERYVKYQHIHWHKWMVLVLWDMRSCARGLVLSVGRHHRGRVNVAPVCECWAPEFSVCEQHGALVFRKIRRPWSDIKVLMSSVAPQCDLVTANSRGTLKCYNTSKVRFLTLWYTPSVFRRHF